MKSILLLSLSILLVACSSMTKEQMKQETAGFSLPYKAGEGEGVVYVIRPSGVGMLVRFNVFLDDQRPESEMGWNRGSQYIYFFAKPGHHTLYSVGANTSEIKFKVKEGKPTFIKQESKFGVVMARNELTVVDELEGTYLVKNLPQGTIHKVRKESSGTLKVPATANQ